MKNALKTCIIVFLCLLFLPNFALAQLYEVSLDEKIEKSTLIVEGKVIESQCYRADDGNIYTANKIELGSILKGEYREKFLTVTTWGGEIDDELQTWTHLLTLSKGDYGLFFLEPTRAPSIQKAAFPESFDVYAGQQGFLAFLQNEAKAWTAYEPFHTYTNLEAELYQHIARKIGQVPMVVNIADAPTRKTGIRYHFTDIVLSGATISFKVYVNSLTDTKKLYRSDLQLSYNPAFFGSNIATNGNLVMSGAGISASSTYSLTQSNVTSSKVKIELAPVGSLTGLTTIGTSEQLLAEGKLTIQNIATDPGISYNLAEMQSMSKFYEGGVAQLFDTVIVEGDWRPKNSCDPVITSITPKSVRGGTGDVIEIRGSCFKDYLEGFSDVWFTDASKGPIPLQWMFPLKSEFSTGCGTGTIICWTDTLIKVRVPSISKFSPDSSDVGKYAGTGRVQVYNSESLLPGVSPEPIVVRFSAKNKFTKATEYPASISLKQTLREANDNGGFTLTFGSNLLADSNAKVRFLEALKTWKCATKVNFDTTSAYPNTGGLVCLIDIGTITMPAGALGTTQESIYRCKQPGSLGNYTRAAVARFTMLFNDSISFYKGADPLAIGASQYDFEAVALHELGHAHELNHVNQSDDIMFFSLAPGISGSAKRSLRADDVEGGIYIMDISKVSYPGTNCSFNPMVDANIAMLGCSTPTSESFTKHTSFIVSPNPARNQIFITTDGPLDEFSSYQVKITDFLGNVFWQRTISSGQKIYQEYDMSMLKEGIYLLTIGTGNHILQSVKIVKI